MSLCQLPYQRQSWQLPRQRRLPQKQTELYDAPQHPNPHGRARRETPSQESGPMIGNLTGRNIDNGGASVRTTESSAITSNAYHRWVMVSFSADRVRRSFPATSTISRARFLAKSVYMLTPIAATKLHKNILLHGRRSGRCHGDEGIFQGATNAFAACGSRTKIIVPHWDYTLSFINSDEQRRILCKHLGEPTNSKAFRRDVRNIAIPS